MTEEEMVERNKNICKEWVEWHANEEYESEPVSELKKRISIKYDITEQYIYQILKANVSILKHNVEWRKFLRVCRLQRLQAGKHESRKDITDLLEQERKELEGEKAAVEINQYTTIWNGAIDKSNKIDQSGRITNA
jgi:hypothetical protein